MHETEVEGLFLVAAYVMAFVYLACTALLKLLSTGRLASRWFVGKGLALAEHVSLDASLVCEP